VSFFLVVLKANNVASACLHLSAIKSRSPNQGHNWSGSRSLRTYKIIKIQHAAFPYLLAKQNWIGLEFMTSDGISDGSSGALLELVLAEYS
jgi:hypothetical protein